MKRLIFLTTLVLTAVLFGTGTLGVSAAELPEMPGVDCEWIWNDSTHTLWAGQHINAGQVIISNDDDYLYIDVYAHNGAIMQEGHVYLYENVDDIPSSRPAPGQAPYKLENVMSDHMQFMIPWDIVYLNDVYPVVHIAFASGTPENPVGGETAYGGDNPGDENWFFYIDHVFDGYWECPDDPGPEPEPECECDTAYAYFGDDSIPFDERGRPWGWYSEFMTGTFPIYAGAGKNNINKGTFVGEVMVEADGTITFNLESGFLINIEDDEFETHFYIGEDTPERIPGQWNTIVADPDEFDFMTFHMVVCVKVEE